MEDVICIKLMYSVLDKDKTGVCDIQMHGHTLQGKTNLHKINVLTTPEGLYL